MYDLCVQKYVFHVPFVYQLCVPCLQKKSAMQKDINKCPTQSNKERYYKFWKKGFIFLTKKEPFLQKIQFNNNDNTSVFTPCHGKSMPGIDQSTTDCVASNVETSHAPKIPVQTVSYLYE